MTAYVAEIQIPELKLQRVVAEIPLAFTCVPWGQHIEIVSSHLGPSCEP